MDEKMYAHIHTWINLRSKEAIFLLMMSYFLQSIHSSSIDWFADTSCIIFTTKNNEASSSTTKTRSKAFSIFIFSAYDSEFISDSLILSKNRLRMSPLRILIHPFGVVGVIYVMFLINYIMNNGKSWTSWYTMKFIIFVFNIPNWFNYFFSL